MLGINWNVIVRVGERGASRICIFRHMVFSVPPFFPYAYKENINNY